MLQTIDRPANMPGPFEVGRREFRRGFNGNGHVRRSENAGNAPSSLHDDGLYDGGAE